LNKQLNRTLSTLSVNSHVRRNRFAPINKPREEGVMSGPITAKTVVTHPYFGMICFLSLTLFLPRYGGIAIMVGCASILSVLVLVLPEQFRSRSGSMMAGWER
jgi:hypothetical protein